MIFVGIDGSGHAVALDVTAPYRLFGNEYNKLYMMVIRLWMGLAAHFHIEKTVTVLEFRKMVLRAFALFLDFHPLHALITAGQ